MDRERGMMVSRVDFIADCFPAFRRGVAVAHVCGREDCAS